MISFRWDGLRRYRAQVRRWPRRLRNSAKRRVKEASRVVQRQMRSEFGPRYTNPVTRKRRDKGKRLGTFTGRGKRNIRTALRFRTARDYTAWVGPSGELGTRRWQSGRAYYLRFHELGTGVLPRRQIVRPAVIKTRSRVRALLGRIPGVLRRA